MTAIRTLALACLALFGLMAAPALAAPALAALAYDPLTVPAAFAAEFIDLDVADTARERTLPVRVWLPATTGPAPVILFSHGLGGSRENSPYLGSHWSARGYVVVFIQHPGSDESVWQDVAPRKRMAAMKEAASTRNFVLRVDDVPAVLDGLAVWNATPGHPLYGRLDLDHVGMSGHSFGARTTQAVSGQSLPSIGTDAADLRIDAALALSPSAGSRLSAEAQFANVSIPWMLMTGTKDTAPIGGETVEDRLKVYPALPPGSKYELVLWEAQHMAFVEREPRRGEAAPNPNHHRVILALSTAFWDAYLKDDAAARAWLEGDGPASVLEPQDRWQHK